MQLFFLCCIVAIVCIVILIANHFHFYRTYHLFPSERISGSLIRYTKLGFAGNVEPCFIIPTVVAVNESFLNPSRTSSKGNWLAQHNAGVMADLDFFIGDEALQKAKSSSTYNLSYPIHYGQVVDFTFSLYILYG